MTVLLRNKSGLLVDQVKNVDVLVISETKLDESFPSGQCIIPGFPFPFRRDRNQWGGSLMVFMKEDIATKFLPVEACSKKSILIK